MEITKKNFAIEFENITKNLKQSCIIGFDAEFTAIPKGECFKYRLFDTNEERYDKIKSEVSKMIMTQVGLTMFQYNRVEESYTSVSYTFHLSPQVLGDIDQTFMFQASTVKFLCRHNFDFNKFTYEGIPYISKVEQNKLFQRLKDKNLLHYLTEDLELRDEKQLQQYCSAVFKWLNISEDETMYIDEQDPVLRYLTHIEVRKRFPKVLTTDSLGNSNKILIYRDENVEGANSASIDQLEENLIRCVMGFSQIMNLLEQYRKPIVGHNVFLDVILLHNQFIGPLPVKYSDFKKNINTMFPVIFDTKYVSHEMGKNLTLDEVWKSNALQDLYEFFADGKCKKLQNGLNTIVLNTTFDVKQSYHEAGWDSYCTGYCFVRLAHWAACENCGLRRPVGPTELLSAMAPYGNKVNVIRGATPYMNLVGDDPPTHRPQLLHIKSTRERIINIEKVAGALAGAGAADLKPCGRRALLVAAGAQYTADKIFNQFKNSPEYKISTYNAFKHTAAGRIAIWSGAFITGSLILLLLHKKVKSTVYT